MYDGVIVCPNVTVPASGSISFTINFKRAVVANGSPNKAILSPFITEKFTLFRSFSPSIVFSTSSTNNIDFPDSRLGLKSTKGYFLVDGCKSSNVILSNIFLRDVACLDFDAFAEKRAINSSNSFIFSSFFLLLSFNCLLIN